MTEPIIHGHTNSRRPVTDQDIENLAAEAEAGYGVETLIARRNKRGRPTRWQRARQRGVSPAGP